MKTKFFALIAKLFHPDEMSPEHYIVLRRLIIIIMITITTLPMGLMIVINHFQYRSHLRSEITAPILTLASKTKHSFELLLEARLSTVRFIATAYTYEELKDNNKMKRILMFLKKEFGGFVDLGLIDAEGTLISYAGPYPLLGKNYAEQISFQEVRIKGKYISNVFMGHRKFPHMVMAVQHLADDGRTWILRATIDTDQFQGLIQSMGLDPKSDAFLIDTDGIFQTDAKFYGKTLEKCPLDISTETFESYIYETRDDTGQNVVIATVGFNTAPYTLVIVKPRSVVLQSWYALKTELFAVFAIGLVLIVIAIIRITDLMIQRLKASDERRENTLNELQHTQKLSSIGRLAAGVAHEINNPLAIINEKAGLMSDIMEFSEDFSHKEKFAGLIDSTLKSVDRCRKITHRLLGFAKRIDVQIESMDINAVVREVLGFLEREALYRKIDIRLKLVTPVHTIISDRGQVQQVILNLLTNAFDAVQDGGVVIVQTDNITDGGIKITLRDNGHGIPEDLVKHIFDPFFSTKKEKGTGLGLSISYGIIDRLGGTINVTSRVGKGTEFIITLPQSSEQALEERNE